MNSTTDRIFKPRALRYLIRRSSGLPRRINVLCPNAMLLAYAGGAHVVDKRMVEAAVTEYDSLFSTLRSRPAGVRDARVRRWLGRALEAVALKMLAVARALNPHEIRAFDDDRSMPPDGGRRRASRWRGAARWPKTSRARPIRGALTLIHLISIPVTNTSVNAPRSLGPALFAGGWPSSNCGCSGWRP